MRWCRRSPNAPEGGLIPTGYCETAASRGQGSLAPLASCAFDITVGSQRDLTKWQSNSRVLDAALSMNSGRSSGAYKTTADDLKNNAII